MINADKVKTTLTKTFVLLTLTGTLVSKDPININKENIVYAATDLTSVKKDSIKELKSIYKKYNKSYYSSKNYNKLTKYYNKAVNLINNAKSLEKIESYLETYKVKLESIKPTKLIKYQNKMEKSLLKTYKALISKYEYSDYNLQEIEDIKEEGLNKIYSSLTKTKSKKAKNSYINKLKEVKKLIEETKLSVISYIYSNNNLSDSEKSEIVQNINNSDSIEDVKQIGDEYGYVKEEKEIVTVDQIEKKIKELVKKYPAYTEDEIRIFVAFANMDYVEDEDILTIFKANSKEELYDKKDKLDEMMETIYDCSTSQKIFISSVSEISYSEQQNDMKLIYGKSYDEIIHIKDLFIAKDMKTHVTYLDELITQVVLKPTTKLDESELTEGYHASMKLAFYLYNIDEETAKWLNADKLGNEYDRSKTINIDDDRLKGGAGYIINKCIFKICGRIGDYRLKQLVPEKEEYPYTKSEQLIEQNGDFISRRFSKQKKL